jgi:hypothetical protein
VPVLSRDPRVLLMVPSKTHSRAGGKHPDKVLARS